VGLLGGCVSVADDVFAVLSVVVDDVDGGDAVPVVAVVSVVVGGVDSVAVPVVFAVLSDAVESAEPVALLASVPVSGVAHATPGLVATAIPTPNATAKAPTRPTYIALFVIAVLPSLGRHLPKTNRRLLAKLTQMNGKSANPGDRHQSQEGNGSKPSSRSWPVRKIQVVGYPAQ
jgi:hypothetical protein